MIGSISNSSVLSQMAGSLFAKLDSKNQGYVEQSDLESAFSTLGSTGTSAGQVFSALDGDGDGKVTASEFSDSLQSLLDELQGQLQSTQAGGMAGMPPPPPPPPEGDQGFTQEELTSMAESLAETDSDMSSLMAGIATDFETADTDGNGRVTHEEAMAYQSTTLDAATSTTGTETESDTTTTGDAASNTDVLRQILELLRAYGQSDEDDSATLLTQA